MAYLDWTDKLSVGIARIDDEHKQLIQMINKLYDGVMARKSQDLLKPTLYEMAKYAAGHFCTEETYMDKFGYTQMESHVREHKDFVGKIEEFLKGYESGKLFLSTEIMDFLKNWLVKHIQGTDKQYTAFFNQSGLR